MANALIIVSDPLAVDGRCTRIALARHHALLRFPGHVHRYLACVHPFHRVIHWLTPGATLLPVRAFFVIWY